MVNSAEVQARIQAGQVLPGWTVLRARAGFFVGFIILGIVLTAIGVLVAVVLVRNPNHVFVLTSVADTGPDTLDPEAFARWRVADMVGVALFAAIGLITAVRYSFDLLRRKQFFLAILPEGIVVNARGTKTYTFATIQGIKASANRTQATLNFTMQPGINPARSRLVLDGRFGNTRSIANQILAAWNRARNTSAG